MILVKNFSTETKADSSSTAFSQLWLIIHWPNERTAESQKGRNLVTVLFPWGRSSQIAVRRTQQWSLVPRGDNRSGSLNTAGALVNILSRMAFPCVGNMISCVMPKLDSIESQFNLLKSPTSMIIVMSEAWISSTEWHIYVPVSHANMMNLEGNK